MSYIGNTPISAAFLTDTFSGTGSQVAYTMTVAPANTSSIIVAVTGVLQDPSTYSVSGTTLTFSAAPPTGTSNISIRYLGIPASGVTTTAYRTVTDFTATAGQTSFSVPSYTVGYIDVYRNGVRLTSTDYTATTGTTVVLTNACTVGDAVVTESFYVSSVLNAIPATAGSVSDSYIVGMSASKLTGTQTIPKTTLPTGSVLQVATNTLDGVITTTTQGVPSTITNGAQVFSLSFTPISATSVILVQTSTVAISENTNFADICWLALWDGSTFIAANSGSVAYLSFSSGYNAAYTSLNNSYAAGSTSTRTISVRAGMNGGIGTVYINGNSYANYTGSSARIQMTVWEIAA